MSSVYPTLDGKEAGRWAPDGRGNGTHFADGAPPEASDDAKKAKRAADKAAKAAEKVAKDKAKALKVVIKEGGKKGVEIAGAADMGGLDFFCSNMKESKGQPELLVASMHAMNKEIDPNEEEQKGGSGHVGKMIFSASEEGDDAQCCAVAYVPVDKQDKLNAKEWMLDMLSSFKPTGTLVGDATVGFAVGLIKHSPSDGRYLLKDQDAMLPAGREYLKKRDLIPEDKDEEDDMEWMQDAEDEIEW